jgi:5'-nucleotidase
LANEFDLPTPIRKLLFEAGQEVEAPWDRRIYTNRNLNLDKIFLIGFDMDYTLGIYRQDAIEELSLQTTIAKLLARGYPEQLLAAESDPRFAIRGLMVDKKFGNIIKMDRHGYVGRAYHGKGVLSRDERKTLYRNQRLGMEHERFAPVDTLFALPEVTLYAEVIELLDKQPALWGADTPTYAETWRDVRECIDEAHRDGSIKDVIKREPAKYIERDPDLPRTLHKLRSAGKRLFLLTNSLLEYTDTVMTYLLTGALPSYADWPAYFDWVVVGSAKPHFFADNLPFQELDREGHPIGPRRQDVQRGKIYEGGNQIGLQRSFDCHGDEVLYVGDHIYGDIVKSKKSSGWRTALIVQELQHEVRVRRAHDMTLREIESLYMLRARLAEAITAHRHQSRIVGRLTAEELVATGLSMEYAEALLEETRIGIRQRLDHLRNYERETLDTMQRRGQIVDEAFNPYWGSSFAERHDASRFGAQVESYACIYTSRVSNFQFVSPAKYFISPHGSLPHW